MGCLPCPPSFVSVPLAVSLEVSCLVLLSPSVLRFPSMLGSSSCSWSPAFFFALATPFGTLTSRSGILTPSHSLFWLRQLPSFLVSRIMFRDFYICLSIDVMCAERVLIRIGWMTPPCSSMQCITRGCDGAPSYTSFSCFTPL